MPDITGFQMKVFKALSVILVLSLVGLPVAVVLTFMLSPFWNWFEAAAGIESMGHSGPAGWCYLVVYISVLLVTSAAYHWYRKGGKPPA